MTDLHAADGHATPLTPAEREDLIPTHITLRSELNELEQQNIATGNRWALGRRHVVTRESFLKSLHRRMFERVWRWAGKYRTTERNLGVAPHLIEVSLRQAIDDARYWIEHKSLILQMRSRCVSITGSSPYTPFQTETAVGLVSPPTF